MAATRTGPPTPPPGRPRPGPRATPLGPAAEHPAPGRPARTGDALRALTALADADGLVAVDLRTLAAELDLTTLATRALLADLVEDRALRAVGRRVYAFGAAREDADDHLPEPPGPAAGPRTPPHDAVHEGTGSPLLW